MSNIIRRRVSMNRKRLVEGRYDLDLTYITDNIVAMGYPSDKVIQSIIRNHITSVAKFLNERHPESYKIFNLCAESDYDFSYFDNMVEMIPFDDHNPPLFEQIFELCEKVDKWLEEKETNVVIVHCKAGKGRTGTMISCYLTHSQLCKTPFDAMKKFDAKRTHDQKGVTIPSQRRYVEYYGDYLLNKRLYEHLEVELVSIKISQQKNFNIKHMSYQIISKNNSCKIFDSQPVKLLTEGNEFNFNESTLIAGDIKIIFFNKAKDIMFSVTFNTYCSFHSHKNNEYSTDPNSYQGLKHLDSDGFVVWTLTKDTIDGLPKNKNYESSFQIEFRINRKEFNLRNKPNEATSNTLPCRESTYDNLDPNFEHYSQDDQDDNHKTRQKVKKAFKKSKIMAHFFPKTSKSDMQKSNSEPSLNKILTNSLNDIIDATNSEENLEMVEGGKKKSSSS